MFKLNETVRRETLYIAVWELIFSLLMEAVFLIAGFWKLPVLWGNLLGAFTAVMNFLLMGVAIQQAVELEEKDAKLKMKASRTMRNFGIVLVAILAGVLPCFNIYSMLIPLLFPRIAIAMRPMFFKNKGKKG